MPVSKPALVLGSGCIVGYRPDIAKCNMCAGQGSRGRFANCICKSFCHACKGTGEASKTQLLELLGDMGVGNVDAATVLYALSDAKRDDSDIVRSAVQVFPKALGAASQRLQGSQELINAAAKVDIFLQKERRRFSRRGSNPRLSACSPRLSVPGAKGFGNLGKDGDASTIAGSDSHISLLNVGGDVANGWRPSSALSSRQGSILSD